LYTYLQINFWPTTTANKLFCIRDIFASFKIASSSATNYDFVNEFIGEDTPKENTPMEYFFGFI